MNPFKICYINNIDNLCSKMGQQSDTPPEHDSFFQLFIHHSTVLIFKSFDELSICDKDECEVIIFVPNSSVTDQLDDTILYKGNEFEQRHLAIINSSSNSWKGKMFSRHDGLSYKIWWESDRLSQINIQVSEDHMNQLDSWNAKYGVYVTTKKADIQQMNRDYLRYIGGQNHVVRRNHNLPLIVTEERQCTCCNITNDTPCTRASYFNCPEKNCNASICKKCFQTFNTDVTTYVEEQNNKQHPSSDNSDSDKSSYESEDDNSENMFDSPFDNIHSSNKENGLLDILRAKEDLDEEDQESDQSSYYMNPLDNYVTTGDMNDLHDKDIIPESIPTTDAGGIAFTIEENIPKGQYINRHVILNQCGSILS